jgi:SSS family solute:Na+ symporter
MNAALIIIGLTALAALALGLRAQAGREMNLEQWAVGGRHFGTILVFVLMAGEIYTTFTFLGGSGYAYGHGGPTYYILAYGCLAYIISYWMLPPIWRYARERRLISQPDFFAAKYASPALGVVVALVGIVALIPYLVLQLKGLGIIVETASYGAIRSTPAIWIGAAVVTGYVMVSGVHGSAWTAVAKDTLILAVAIFLGIYLPIHLYGGYGAMFAAIDAARPGFLALPAKGESVAWFDSTVMLTALGFFMWPHSFGSVFTARAESVFRRNAIVLPLYQLILAFIFFVGFAAVLKVPGLTGPNIDLSLFRLSIRGSWG